MLKPRVGSMVLISSPLNFFEEKVDQGREYSMNFNGLAHLTPYCLLP